MDEYLSVFDKKGKLLNEKINRKEINNLSDDKYFKIVLIYIKNSDEKYLIQKCSIEKGGEFATTGGQVPFEVSSIDTARIELEEELDLKVTNEELIFFKNYIFKKALVDVYLLEKDIDLSKLTLQKEEVDNVYWMTKEEILNLMNINAFRKSNIESFKDIIEIKE